MHDAVYLRAPLAMKPGSASRFKGVAYTGAAIEMTGERVVIDLAQTSIAPSLPLLHEHERASVIGSIKAAANSGTNLSIEGELFSDIDETAAALAEKAKRGVRFQLSVGLFGARSEDERGRVSINGRAHRGPLMVLRGGTVREVSVVTLGADPATIAELFSAHRRRSPLDPVGIYAARNPAHIAVPIPTLNLSAIYARRQTPWH